MGPGVVLPVRQIRHGRANVAIVDIGAVELIIVLAIALLLFGSRLPKVARSLGQAKSEFKKGVDDANQDSGTGTSSGAK